MKTNTFLTAVKAITFVVLIAGALGGCSRRYILDVTDHGSQGGATLVQTLDTKNFVVVGVRKHVFWECREDSDSLDCTRVCDRKDEQGAKVLCPKSYVWPW